jgi:hypothetical protein
LTWAGLAGAFAAGRDGFLAGAGLFLTTDFFTGFFFAVAILRYPPVHPGSSPRMQLLLII